MASSSTSCRSNSQVSGKKVRRLTRGACLGGSSGGQKGAFISEKQHKTNKKFKPHLKRSLKFFFYPSSLSYVTIFVRQRNMYKKMFFSTVKNDFRLNAFRTKKNTSQKTFRVPSNDSLKSMTELAVVAFFLMIVGDICIAIATGAPALRTPIPPVHNTQVHNVGTVHSD